MFGHHLRRSIPSVVAANGIRCRRHFAELAARGEPLASGDGALGVLRVLDDVTMEPGVSMDVGVHDGFEVVVYVLDGECVMADHGATRRTLRRDDAATARLGAAVAYTITNTFVRPTRILFAELVSPSSEPKPTFALRSFGGAEGLVWFASDRPGDGALALSASARLALATLDPGSGVDLPHAADRATYIDVLEGNTELGAAFLDAGGAARLDAPGRLGAITRSRVLVADVALGFAQLVV